MSTTPSEFKVSLVAAIRTADLVYVDGDPADCYLEKETDRDGFFDMNDAAENRYDFKDQEIEVCDGLSQFVGLEGEVFNLRFNMTRRMTQLDVVTDRLAR